MVLTVGVAVVTAVSCPLVLYVMTGVEVAPPYDPTTVPAQAGAQILFEILSLVALAPRRGRVAVAED